MAKDTRKIQLASLGVVGEVGEKSAYEGAGWLVRHLSNIEGKPSRDQISDLTKKLPPETHALLAIQSLIAMAELLVQQRESRVTFLTLSDEDEHALAETLRDSLIGAIERLRSRCHAIQTAVSMRAVEGYPAWDYDLGCVKGGSPEPVEYDTDDLLRLVLGQMEDDHAL